jgi:hypothetical protein
MKNSNAVFEIFMMAVTILFGFTAIVSEDSRVAALFWLLVLGFLQVSHSIILGTSYWKNIRIRKALIIYWLGVITNFLFISVNSLLDRKAAFIDVATILVLPLSLAVYLLWITCYFCLPVKKHKSP